MVERVSRWVGEYVLLAWGTQHGLALTGGALTDKVNKASLQEPASWIREVRSNWLWSWDGRWKRGQREGQRHRGPKTIPPKTEDHRPVPQVTILSDRIIDGAIPA